MDGSKLCFMIPRQWPCHRRYHIFLAHFKTNNKRKKKRSRVYIYVCVCGAGSSSIHKPVFYCRVAKGVAKIHISYYK